MKSKYKEFDCIDCGVSTVHNHEYYMVKKKVWRAVGNPKGMLCIGCLEGRLGRQLVRTDFLKCPVNSDLDHRRSDRLSDRLGVSPYVAVQQDPLEALRGMILYIADDVDDMIDELERPDSDEEPELAPTILRMLADALDKIPGLAEFFADDVGRTDIRLDP
jgi:hypothetical protein